MQQAQGYRSAQDRGGGRSSLVVPPPYRAPPPGPPGQPGPPPLKGSTLPYSRFNTSEPNMAGSPVGYRHTINHEHSSQVQSNLKQMLNLPKHQTLDNQTQNAAIHHLRMQGLQNGGGHQSNGDVYTGPDSIRNTANKMFSRNSNERGSSGYSYSQQFQQGLSQSQHSLNQQLNQSINPSPHQSLNHSLNQSIEMTDSRTNGLSFRSGLHSQNPAASQGHMSPPAAATAGPGQQLHNQKGPKQPPLVPPKPGSRSASKDRSKDDRAVKDGENENEYLENELSNILRGTNSSNNNNNHEQENNNGSSGTPPLPPLSPSQSNSHTPQSSPDFRMKYSMNQARPDLIQTDSNKMGMHKSKEDSSVGRRVPNSAHEINRSREGKGRQEPPEEIASTITGLDLESVMALQTDLTSDEELSTTIDLGDAQAIRRQLDGLENMYTEVLKLLGLRKFGRPPTGADSKGGPAGRRKMYGSMSSLPSVSSIGSRHLYSKDKRKDDRKNRNAGKDKNYNKRFQRLESHVVTLARSVAHLSSEMRTQHAMAQDIEAIRNEIQQLKMSRAPHTNSLPRGGVLEPQEFFSHHPRVSLQTENRVKKLTKFFGDEPPLLRLYLKNLGYEKYAGLFEEAKIGMLELPYLSEDRLEKLGIPLGPRIRILQEAKIPYNVDGQNYNVYIL